jgi:predicted nucleotidyltransferase
MNHTAIAALAQKHGIRLLLQFGSSVTAHLHQGSDIDLAALLEHVPDTFGADADLRADLQTLVPDRDVDVTLINRADPLLLKQIAEHHQLLYGTSRELDAFRRYAFKRYQDHRPYLALERDYVDQMLERMKR